MLEVSLQLEKVMPSGTTYKQRLEQVDALSDETLGAIREKHEGQGWEVLSWTATIQLPWDEGYAAGKAGQDSKANPYALLSQKHIEWWEGFNAHRNADPDQ